MDPWYATFFLLIGHIVLIPGLVIQYKTVKVMSMAFYVFAMQAFVIVCSTFYHTCASTGFCMFGASLLAWTQMDYIYAVGQIVVIWLVLLTNGTEEDVYKQFWTFVVILVLQGAVIVMVLSRLANISNPLGAGDSLIIILLGVIALFIKAILIDRGKTRIFSKFANPFVAAGSAIIAGGVVFFLLDSADLYWFYHSLWHMLVFLGLNLTLYGVAQDIPVQVDTHTRRSTQSLFFQPQTIKPSIFNNSNPKYPV